MSTAAVTHGKLSADYQIPRLIRGGWQLAGDHGQVLAERAVDDMALGTANGPMRLGPLVRTISAASMSVRVDGPPEPMMMPERSLEMSEASSPESAIA